jgi:hypothetical protein
VDKNSLGQEALNLTASQLERRLAFLRAYGRTCLRELEQLSQFDDRPVRRSQQARWDVQADAASTLTEAAQIAFLIDDELARRLLDDAGELYTGLGHPFGLYLKSVAGLWRPAECVQRVSSDFRILEQVHAGRGAGVDQRPVPRAWHSPQQQAYFVLAAASVPPLGSRSLRRRVLELTESSPHRQGVAPTGALGTPLFRLWDIAIQLLREQSPDEAAIAICTHLVEMSSRYAERIRLAMVNEYLWRHVAAPVDLTSIEISGIAVLASRVLSPELFFSHAEHYMANLSPLARIPVELGLRIAAPPPEEPVHA